MMFTIVRIGNAEKGGVDVIGTAETPQEAIQVAKTQDGAVRIRERDTGSSYTVEEFTKKHSVAA